MDTQRFKDAWTFWLGDLAKLALQADIEYDDYKLVRNELAEWIEAATLKHGDKHE